MYARFMLSFIFNFKLSGDICLRWTGAVHVHRGRLVVVGLFGPCHEECLKNKTAYVRTPHGRGAGIFAGIMS